jgi:hypothetical protein
MMGKARYEISGTAYSVNVTMENGNGGTDQYSDVLLPHTYTVNMADFLYCSAQNNGSTGSVKVEIYNAWGLVAEGSANGAYCIATASH